MSVRTQYHFFIFINTNSKNVKEFWFDAANITRFIGISQPSPIINELDEEDVKPWHILNSGNFSNQLLNIYDANSIFVSELGLYALTFRSNTFEARILRRWLFDYTLPELRTTNSLK